MAQENEAMVISLNNKIEQLRENASGCLNNGAEDAESCCDVSGRAEEGFLDAADDIPRKDVCQTPKKASVEALMM
ncbi:hypothetical protein OIU78_008771 [Salix suchowensis]|nr:hypothetical protein OIU78_008771 [Salix suchowensis]